MTVWAKAVASDLSETYPDAADQIAENLDRVIAGLADDRARSIAERLRAEVAAHPFMASPDLAIPLSVSIGVAQARRADTALDVDGMLGRADAALFEAKHAGRNRVTFAAAAA